MESAARDAVMDEAGEITRKHTWSFPTPHPGVVPNEREMAQDSTLTASFNWALQNNSIFTEGLAFPGYAYLSELTQRAEYRRPAEILAKEMTRKWLKIKATGDDDSDAKEGKIATIEAEFRRLNVQNVIRKAAELDGYFGRAQIYLDTGFTLKDRTEIDKPLPLTKEKIPAGSLRRLTVVEPIWTYPDKYNTTDPLSPEFYRPSSWFVMGAEVHSSRLLTVIGRPMPDMLKPAYAFGGLSLSQMAKPYVDNWLRTRQSVSDLIHAFSVMVLATDMGQQLQGGANQKLGARIKLFNAYRDNKGTFVIDKASEDFKNVAAPISGLDALQAQSQEQMSAVTGIPLSILLGITPHGLNASNEGEIRTFYGWVEAQQESMLTPIVEHILKVAQLSLFGEIDPEIGFAWEPLWAMSKKDLADIEKTKAETDDLRLNQGTISVHEARARIAKDEDSPYAGLDLEQDPIPPAGEEDEDLLAGMRGPGEPSQEGK